MTNSNIQLLGAGSPIVDILINISDDFVAQIDGAKGGMELVSPDVLDDILAKSGKEPVKSPGGSAANTIFGLTHLGIKTGLLGKVGKDAEGDYYCSRFEECGGSKDFFKMNQELPTGRCLSLVTPDSERTMRTDLGAAASLSAADISQMDFPEGAFVHVEGYLLFNGDLIKHVLDLAKKSNCVVSLDLASFEVVNAAKAVLPELLEKVDIVFSNEDEAKAFCGSDDPQVALEKLNEYCNIAVVKVGKDGAFIKKRGEATVKVDAILVDAVDTTGAGDLWQAGFLYGLLKNKPLDVCGNYGSVLGSEVVQIMGAAISNEKWTDIKAQLNNIG